MELIHTVAPDEEGQKIGTLLRNKLKISARLLTKLKMNQKILVDDAPVFSSYLVQKNDKITVEIDFDEEDYIVAENTPLTILYEDEYLLAVNKTAGIVVHPSAYHPNGTLANAVKHYLDNHKKIRPINRLDRDTSGIVLFAKNEYIQEIMKNDGEMKKEYQTIVTGKLNLPANEKHGTINLPIARKKGSIMERIISEEGQNAITHYKIVKEFSLENQQLSLLHVTLETGRTHQIRVHFKHLGHPLLGDTLYGNESNFINRQALHAWKLTFTHPITNKKIEIIAEIPEDMKHILQQGRS